MLAAALTCYGGDLHQNQDPYVLEADVRQSAIEKAKKLIKGFELLRLKAYVCPAGHLTIGYGHTGDDVYAGKVITTDQAEALLEIDMARFVDTVDAAVKVPLTDGQAAALTSFMFNVGVGAFMKSTLLKKLNTGDYAGAAEELLRWNKANGAVLAGLDNRRHSEKAVFEGLA
jgi:lysozyme